MTAIPRDIFIIFYMIFSLARDSTFGRIVLVIVLAMGVMIVSDLLRNRRRVRRGTNARLMQSQGDIAGPLSERLPRSRDLFEPIIMAAACIAALAFVGEILFIIWAIP